MDARNRTEIRLEYTGHTFTCQGCGRLTRVSVENLKDQPGAMTLAEGLAELERIGKPPTVEAFVEHFFDVCLECNGGGFEVYPGEHVEVRS